MTTPRISQRFRDAPTPLGEKILEFADANNTSLVGVARMIGIDHHVIHRAVVSPSWTPYPKIRALICETLRISEDDLTALGVADGSSHRRRRWHPCRKCGTPIPPRRTYCSQGCFDTEWRVSLPPAAFRDPLRTKVLAGINASGLKVYPWAEQYGLHAQNFANWLRDPKRKLSRRNLMRIAAPLGLGEEETIALAGGTVEEWRGERIQELRMPLPKLRRHLNRIRQIPRSAAARAAISERMRGRAQTQSQHDAVMRDSHSLSGRLRRMMVGYKVVLGHYPNGDRLDELAARANDRYAVGDVTSVKSQMAGIINRLSGGKDRRGRKAYYDHLEICKRRRAGRTWAVIAQAVPDHAIGPETVRPAHALWHSRKKTPPCLPPS